MLLIVTLSVIMLSVVMLDVVLFIVMSRSLSTKASLVELN